MAETKIEWTRSPSGEKGYTFNGWEGCQKVSPGCDHCYAEARNQRFGSGENWGPGAPRRRTGVSNWNRPKRWNKEAKSKGVRLRVFTASLSDWLDNAIPLEWTADLLMLVMETDGLDWLMLTKRIGLWFSRMSACHELASTDEGRLRWPGLAAWLKDWTKGKAPSHVFVGASIVNQEEAHRDIHKLLSVPAVKHFLSMEPLLGPVDLNKVLVPNGILRNMVPATKKLDWVIVGGESGPGARPMHPGWARSLRDQCEAAGVTFMFKQWGGWAPARDGIEILASSNDHQFEDGTWMERVGRKQEAGRQLDGQVMDGVPA